MWVAFALQSLDVNFNESLTNDIVSFEQLGPGPLWKVFCSGRKAQNGLHISSKEHFSIVCDPKNWPLNTDVRLIQVAFKTGYCLIQVALKSELTVYPTLPQLGRSTAFPTRLHVRPASTDYLRRLIRVFAVRLNMLWILCYLQSAMQKPWSGCADSRADLSPRWAHVHTVWSVFAGHSKQRAQSIFWRTAKTDKPASTCHLTGNVPVHVSFCSC